MKRRNADRGFSLVEIIIAVAVLSIALVGLLSLIYRTRHMNAVARENLTAMRAAEKMIETLRNADFDKVFASYNAVPADDPPPGPGTAAGPDFVVDGLRPVPGDPDGKCGKIRFPTDPSGAELREDQNDPDLMLPRDLNGNKTIDAVSVAADTKLLPMTLEIQWAGLTGPRTMTYRYVLLKK